MTDRLTDTALPDTDVFASAESALGNISRLPAAREERQAVSSRDAERLERLTRVCSEDVMAAFGLGAIGACGAGSRHARTGPASGAPGSELRRDRRRGGPRSGRRVGAGEDVPEREGRGAGQRAARGAFAARLQPSRPRRRGGPVRRDAAGGPAGDSRRQAVPRLPPQHLAPPSDRRGSPGGAFGCRASGGQAPEG